MDGRISPRQVEHQPALPDVRPAPTPLPEGTPSGDISLNAGVRVMIPAPSPTAATGTAAPAQPPAPALVVPPGGTTTVATTVTQTATTASTTTTQTVASTASAQATSASPVQSPAVERQMAILDAIREQFPKAGEADRRAIFKVALGPDLQKLPPNRAVWLASVAHVRHAHTGYDELLREHDWSRANAMVTSDINRKLLEWGSRQTTNIRPDNRAAFRQEVIEPNRGRLDIARDLRFKVQTAALNKDTSLKPLLTELATANADLGRMLLYYGLATEAFGPDESAAREQKEIAETLTGCEKTLRIGRETLARHELAEETPGIFYEKERGAEADDAESSRLYDRLAAEAEARQAKGGGQEKRAEPGQGRDAQDRPGGGAQPKKPDGTAPALRVEPNLNRIEPEKEKKPPPANSGQSAKSQTALPKTAKDKAKGRQDQPQTAGRKKKWDRPKTYSHQGSKAPETPRQLFAGRKDREQDFDAPSTRNEAPKPETRPQETKAQPGTMPPETKPSQQPEKKAQVQDKPVEARQPTTGDAAFRKSREYIRAKIESGKGPLVRDKNIDIILQMNISRGFLAIRKVLIEFKYISSKISLDVLTNKYGKTGFLHLNSIIGEYLAKIDGKYDPRPIGTLVRDCFLSYCCRKNLIEAFQAVVGGDTSRRDEVVRSLIAAMKISEALGSGYQSIYKESLLLQPVAEAYLPQALARGVSDYVAMHMSDVLNRLASAKPNLEYSNALQNILIESAGNHRVILSGLKKNFGFNLGLDAEHLINIACGGNKEYNSPEIVNELKAFNEIKYIIKLVVLSARDKSLRDTGIAFELIGNMAAEKFFARRDMKDYIVFIARRTDFDSNIMMYLEEKIGEIIHEISIIVNTFDRFINENLQNKHVIDALFNGFLNAPVIDTKSALSERSARDIIQLTQLPVFSDAAFFNIGLGTDTGERSAPIPLHSDEDIGRTFAKLAAPWKPQPPQAHMNLLSMYFRGRVTAEPETLKALMLHADDDASDEVTDDICEALDYMALYLNKFG